MKIWRDLLVIVVIFGAVWAVFTWRPMGLPSADMSLNREREQELSELILDDLRSENTFYADSVVELLLDPIVDRLLKSIVSPKYNYKLHLVENTAINAFATLDGHVFVYSGLVKFASGPEEIAAIIAHELGHHENGDLTDKVIKELGLNVVMAILTGGDAVMAGEVTRLLLSTGFDRKQEREADEFAHVLLAKSQLNPARMAHFFTRLKTAEKTYPDDLEVIMTHPSSKNRIEQALKAELPEDFVEIEYDLDWEVLIKGL